MGPGERCRRGQHGDDLGSAGAGNNPARGALGLAFAALALGGCSLSFPIKGVEPADVPTGSIDRTAALLSPALDGEDLRRAKAAMAVALDPQGNGARSGWLNPQTGAHGSFTAAGAPFADQDRVCRKFQGEVAPLAGGERHIAGSACREGDGTWRVGGGSEA